MCLTECVCRSFGSFVPGVGVSTTLRGDETLCRPQLYAFGQSLQSAIIAMAIIRVRSGVGEVGSGARVASLPCAGPANGIYPGMGWLRSTGEISPYHLLTFGGL